MKYKCLISKFLFYNMQVEGRPDSTGVEMSKELAAAGVPIKLILDSAVAYTMEKIDMVLFGADGVVESGGIINTIGTFQTALVAQSKNKPVYVAAESFKVCSESSLFFILKICNLLK